MHTMVSPDDVDAVVQALKAETQALAAGEAPQYAETLEHFVELLGGIAVNLARIAAAAEIHNGGIPRP
jgi:hypothetical protein